MTGTTPHDQATRDRIAHSLGENLFVEAGAGTGKTTALVARMVSLVVDEEVPVEEIVAITFTEKAAAELGDRFRRELEEVARHDVDQERRWLADLALADVDLAALTTLHGFARRLLRFAARHGNQMGAWAVLQPGEPWQGGQGNCIFIESIRRSW